MGYSCVCDKCEDSFHIEGVLRPRGLNYWLYCLDSGIRFPMLKTRGWCKECNAVRSHEIIPDARAISAALESLEAQRRDFVAGRQFPFGKSLASLALEAERNQNAWRSWAQNRTAPRCLTCGSTEIVSCKGLDDPKDGVVLEVAHPRCGGQLTIRRYEDEIRINPRRYTVDSEHEFVQFNARGLLTGQTLERRIEWLDREQEGLSNYLWDSLELYKRTGDLLELSQPRYGDAMRRRVLRSALERFMSDVLAQRAISAIDPQSFPALFPDLHNKAGILIRSFLDSLEITEPVPRTATSAQAPGLLESDVLTGGRLPASVQTHPFYFLGLTPRDTRHTIVEKADEASLHKDAQLCQKARSDLTNPRARITAELSWFPGLSPKRVNDCLRQLSVDLGRVKNFPIMPDLASANMVCAAVDLLDEGCNEDLIVALMSLLIDHSKNIRVEDVFSDINADRQVSGFAEIKTHDLLESEIAERMRHYRQSITQALNRLDSEQLLTVILRIVNDCLEQYEEDTPDLIHEVVDAYATETLGILEGGSKNVEALSEAVRAGAARPGPALDAKVSALEKAVLSWSRVAKPIELSMESRGLEHEPSVQMARKLRALNVHLFQEHDLIDSCLRINQLILQSFREIAEVEQLAQQDDEALKKFVSDKKDQEKSEAQWAQRIRFDADIGLVFKDTLHLGVDGVSWKGRNYPLDTVTRTRWGGVRHSVNGIPTGTEYTIAFGDNSSESVVQIKREAIYSDFIGKLWTAVGYRIVGYMLDTFKRGQSIRFGEALISDDGVVLTRRKLLGANQQQKCTWSQVQIWSSAGCLVIGSKEDEKLYASMSYIDVTNVHFIEHIIRANFKKPGATLLSNSFD
jgi:hypothetical protein